MGRNSTTILQIKQELGRMAAKSVVDDMIIGLGTGTTCSWFIDSLIQRKKEENLRFKVVPSSEDSKKKALQGNLEIIDDEEFTAIDFAVDGADEVDSSGNMIKGGGGALTREKIVLRSAQRRLIIADETKEVERLGSKTGLPIEILRFGVSSTIKQLQNHGYQGKQRLLPTGDPFLTDNGNFIFDVGFPSYFPCPENDEIVLRKINGVIETGFILEKTDILIGYLNGHFNFKN